jgi:ribose transport system substrate-binding protein
MKRRTLLQATVATVAIMISMPAFADPMTDAKAVVDKYASKVSAWDGPTSGPKAAAGKNIVILAADMKNGGILGVVNGVQDGEGA